MWIIDPIDGTNSFIAGGGAWGTLIALMANNQLQVGVVEQPVASRRTWARLGEGAFRRESGQVRPLQVSGRTSLEGSRSTPMPDDTPNAFRNGVESLWSGVFQHSPPASREEFDHPSLLVAAGRSDFALTFGQPWDIAAAAIIVTEAGGTYTDMRGTTVIDTGTGVFTNGHLHEDVLARLHRGETR